MFAANTYAIRLATEDDEASLNRLAGRDAARPLQRLALIGHIGGDPALGRVAC
jgi:hypothetical protein